jgi:Dehydrogenases with different specificities (related to short-chain alcohol dehydrogenases)
VNKNYSEIRSLLNTNLLGPILIAKESYKYLKKQKCYLILFTSSSYTRGRSEYAIYSATKSAIVNLVQRLTEEWIKDEIKVNAICPDRTDKPLRKKVFKDDKKNLLDPGYVAKKTLFLLKNKITGQVYKIKNEKIF